MQLALDYFGLESVPENNFNSSTNGLIYSFVPPASDSDKLFYIYIQDYWCDVKDVSIEFKQARVENGEIIFDIHWTNKGFNNIDIGPDFIVYKYDKDKPIQLEQKGIWHLYREMLAGKGMIVAGDDTVTFEYEKATSYNLSEHYDVLTPGKYRFEAHGAWVEFQIIDKCSKSVTLSPPSPIRLRRKENLTNFFIIITYFFKNCVNAEKKGAAEATPLGIQLISPI